MYPAPSRYILTLSCRDARGIVAAVAGFLAAQDGFIIESAQFGDPSTERFFMRVEFNGGPATPPEADLKNRFHEQVGAPFGMEWHLHDRARKARVLVMVSKIGHCLNDLLYRYRTAQLPIEIPAVISNHEDFRSIVEWHGIAFHHLPISPSQPSPLKGEGLAHTSIPSPPGGDGQGGGQKNPGGGRNAQEAQVLEIIARHAADTVILARYMQILSPDLCAKLSARAINIHHSFLPSFKGARPYHQAYDKGVKLIGATAHYVTTDLDEGPIIEQEVARVDHTHSPETLAAIGRDIECQVLARALRFHIEQRVLMNGHKTVVFK